MEIAENGDVLSEPLKSVPLRFFWRRVFAYLIDLMVLAAFLSALAVLLNVVSDTKFMAPSFVNSKYCKPANFMSSERFDNIIPVEPGVLRSQSVCKYTTMGVTTSYIGVLASQSKKNGITHKSQISLPIDKNGNRIRMFPLDPIMYLFAPLFFALLISRYGKTDGKRWMGLRVTNKYENAPDFKTAMKREYIKGLPLVISALVGIVEVYLYMEMDFESSVILLDNMTGLLNFVGGFGVAFAVGISISIALFWFMFGSFIRWRGQSYWDRWTGLFVNGNVKLRPPAASARSQTNVGSQGTA